MVESFKFKFTHLLIFIGATFCSLKRDEEGGGKNRKGIFMSIISMKNLLEAGVHFGHHTKRWNPKMKNYIFTSRNGIHIIDLRLTVEKCEEAYAFIKNISSEGGYVLFVGTKKQAQDIVKEEAERCGMPYINQRWLGGTLTNFLTIRERVERLKNLKKQEEEGYISKLSIKIQTKLRREKEKLTKILTGIKEMTSLPQVVFVTDTHKERSAILESRKLKIPIISIIDTNCDPDEVDFPLPGNDDAIRSIRFFTSLIGDAVIEGREGQILTEAEAVKSEEVLVEPTVKEKSEELIPEERLEELISEVEFKKEDEI